jgi:cation transport ATPase
MGISFRGSAQTIQIEQGSASICGASDPRLDGIARAFLIGRVTIRVVRQNLFSASSSLEMY